MDAAAIIQANQIEVERFTVKVDIPNNDIARLMYYLNCVCTVIDCTDDSDIRRFISYQNWQGLSSNERNALIALCRTINPDILRNKVFFPIDALCINFTNEFYKINEVQNRIVAADSIIIAGRIHRVNKIMTYKQEWLQTFYYGPIQRLTSPTTYSRQNTIVQSNRYSQPTPVRTGGSRKGLYICCTILCIIVCVVPTLIGIIMAIINSNK